MSRGWRGAGGLWPLALPIVGFYGPAILAIGIDSPAGPMTDGGLRVTLETAGSTLAVAGGGALFALFWGGWQGLLLGAFSIPGARVLTLVLLLPFLLPTAVVSSAVVALFGRSRLTDGYVGAALVGGVQMAPLVLWGVARSIRAMPFPERCAALSFLSPWRRVGFVLGPRAFSAAAGFAGLVFLLLVPRMEAAGYAGVPSVVGFRVLSAFTMGGNPAEGWRLIALLGVGMAPLIYLGGTWLKERVPRSLPSPGAGFEAAAMPSCLLWGIALVYAVPAGRLVVDAGPLPWSGVSAWLEPGAPGAGGLVWEIARAGGVSTVLVILGWRLALGRNAVAGVLFSLPLFLPESLPALVLLEVRGVLPASWSDAPLLLSVAQGVRFGGVAFVLGFLAAETVPRGERDAAHLIHPARSRWRILLPRAAPSLRVGGVFIALLILAEVECAVLLSPPGYAIPSVGLSQFLHYRYDAHAARLALILAGVGLAALTLLAGRRRELA